MGCGVDGGRGGIICLVIERVGSSFLHVGGGGVEGEEGERQGH